MGTLAPAGGPLPTAAGIANFYAIMKQIFPGSTSENPEQETYNALEAAISIFTLQLQAPAAKATATWDAFVAANPDVTQIAPASTWARLLTIAQAKLGIATAQAALAGFVTQVNEWWANASQTATGTGPNVPVVPTIPAGLVPAISAAIAAVAAL